MTTYVSAMTSGVATSLLGEAELRRRSVDILRMVVVTAFCMDVLATADWNLVRGF